MMTNSPKIYSLNNPRCQNQITKIYIMDEWGYLDKSAPYNKLKKEGYHWSFVDSTMNIYQYHNTIIAVLKALFSCRCC